MRRTVLAAIAAVTTICLSGCSAYQGINSLTLPGTEGTGADSYQVTMQLANANAMVPNTPVMINDINVGTVTAVSLIGWTPTLTLSLRKGVRLPANAVASLGQTSLLGSKHVELSAPTGVPAQGTLRQGAVITVANTHAYPETEDLLSGLSLLLNGGGLQSFQTITTELNKALGGRTDDARDLLTQLDSFTGGLDAQKDDIISAMRGLDRVSGTLAPRMGEVDTALRSLPAGLDTVDRQEPALRDTLDRFGEATESIAPFADDGSKQLRGVLQDIEPVLRHTADVQKGTIPRALRLLPGLIFPIDAVPFLVRGDWVNLDVNLDLTDESLDSALLSGTPAAGLLADTAKLQQGRAPLAPLRLPALGGALDGSKDKSGTGPVDGLRPSTPKPEKKDGGLLPAVPGFGG